MDVTLLGAAELCGGARLCKVVYIGSYRKLPGRMPLAGPLPSAQAPESSGDVAD